MKSTATLVIILFVSLTVFSQSPFIEWQKSLGGSDFEGATSIRQTSDGGYIVAGWSQSNDGDVTGNHGLDDYWVVKLSVMGSIEWQKSLGGSDNDRGHSIIQTTDGGYILIGSSKSNDGDVSGNHGLDDYWVVKLTPNGIIDWQKSLGGSGQDFGNDIIQIGDGGYIVLGTSYSNDGDVTGNNGGGDCWIVKLSPQGNIEWQKSIGDGGDEHPSSIKQTSEGGYIISGNYWNPAYPDLWIVKLEASGIIEWQEFLGQNNHFDVGSSVVQTLDGGYMVAGGTDSNFCNVSGNSGDNDCWIVKYASSGTREWIWCFGGGESESGRSVEQTPDGGYIFGGSSSSNDGDVIGNHGGFDYWVVKLTLSGAVEWSKSLGGSGMEYLGSSFQTIDGGYIAAGSSNSNDGDVSGNHGGSDFWIVKLSSELGVGDSKVNNSVLLYPNPNTGKFSIDFLGEIEPFSITVVDALGKTVYSETNISSGIFEIDQNFASGIYFVNVSSTTSATTIKMIVK